MPSEGCTDAPDPSQGAPVYEVPVGDLPPRFSEIPESVPLAGAEPPKHASGGKKKAGFAAVLLFLAAKAKSLLVGAKFLLPVLKTSGTMFISVWVYALRFGLPFGVGIVLSIFVHEMGHVFVAWRQGVPVSAPIFIPFMGAVIIQKRSAKTAWAEAMIGIGGPLGGTLAALICWGIYAVNGNQFFLALAYFGFLINLFNLTPMFPLDGGWIVAAVSPYLWLAGLVVLIGLTATGFLRNPLVIILIVLSVPTMWRGLKNKGEYFPGLQPATGPQKAVMGLSYVCLVGFLLWAMTHSHITRLR